MKKFNETPEFLALQAEWDAKLRDEGFEDIEYRKDPTRMRGMSVGDLARGLYREDKEDYYRWARQHTHTMPEGPERHVWRLHAEGTSPKKIFQGLGRRYGMSQYRVDQIITEQKEAMTARIDSEHEEPEEYTVRTLIAEETRPVWYTQKAKGSVKELLIGTPQGGSYEGQAPLSRLDKQMLVRAKGEQMQFAKIAKKKGWDK